MKSLVEIYESMNHQSQAKPVLRNLEDIIGQLEILKSVSIIPTHGNDVSDKEKNKAKQEGMVISKIIDQLHSTYSYAKKALK